LLLRATSCVPDCLTLGGFVSLLTLTLTPSPYTALFRSSRATADSVWLPLGTVVVFHTIAYGLVVSSGPRLVVPSSLNCTPTTPTLSEAVAETGTVVPDTVAPSIGADIATIGGVASLATVTLTTALALVLPAGSRATADSVWLPFGTVVVSHRIEYGLVVSSAPTLIVPSSLPCPPTSPPLSDAVAETGTVVPDTVAPSAGADIVTLGGVVSLLTVTFTTALAP